MKEFFINYFTQCYRNLSGDMVYDLDLNSKNITLIDNFLKRVEKEYEGSFGESSLFEYIIFQFNYYKGLKTRFGVNNIQLNWITGKKAIDRWNSRKENFQYWNDQFKQKYNIIKVKTENGKFKNDGKEYYQRQERLRFYNTDEGLIHCTEFILFNKDSKECKECINLNICKL